MKYNSLTSEERTTSVMNLITGFVLCWNKKDLNTFGDYFTENAEYTDITGQTALGVDNIVKQHEYPFAVVNKNAVFTINRMLIRDLSDSLIIVSGSWITSGSNTPDGKLLPDRKGIIQMICELKNDKWLLRLVYNNDDATIFFKEDIIME